MTETDLNRDFHHPLFRALSMRILHLGPYLRIAQIVELLANAITPSPVNSQPFPIAEISG